MSWEWVSLVGMIIIGILLIIFRNTAFVKKNWKYFLILTPLVVLIILKIISSRKSSGGNTPSSTNNKDEELERSIGKLRDRLEDVQMETAIEVSAARTKNKEIIEQLEEIKKIEDTSERRKRLAAMIG